MLTILTALTISIGAGTINLYYKNQFDIIFYAGILGTMLFSIELLRTVLIIKINFTGK